MTSQLMALLALIFGLSSFAQNIEPLLAPPDVSLQLRTEGDRHQFYVGELIPVSISYTADTSSKYIWVNLNEKLEGGRGLDVSCSPTTESAPGQSLPDLNKFAQMLNAPCGVGGGVGGGCGDCDSEQLLSSVPLTFGIVPLNTYVHLRSAGTYACVASAANITMAPLDEKIRPALLLESSPLALTIVSDPAWAHSAAISYAEAYDKLCQGDDVQQRHWLQCSDVAERITYLDTIDSLAAEVKFFDGRNHGWDNGFWNAIQHTSLPSDALRLMTNRVQDPDFQVSTWVLEWLAAWEMSIESPDAFQTAPPETYHIAAVEKLRKYVRLLGSSLSNKNASVLQESAKTYHKFAEQEYCAGQPLIEKEERNQALTALGIRPQFFSIAASPDRNEILVGATAASASQHRGWFTKLRDAHHVVEGILSQEFVGRARR